MFIDLVRGWSASVPARCEVCRAWPARPLCDACTSDFVRRTPRCARCALAVPEGVQLCGRCLRSPPPLDACHALVSYGFPWASLVARYKFAGQAGWADTFARLMRADDAISDCVAAADWLVPMPLSPRRLRERGFNQAHELARRMCAAKCDPALALRVRETPPQAELGLDARMANVRHAFSLEPARAAGVRGRRIVLVDDVMTSGASLFALAAVFRDVCVASISAIVFARTEPS